jgi:hypothetical protein
MCKILLLQNLLGKGSRCRATHAGKDAGARGIHLPTSLPTWDRFDHIAFSG